MKRDGRTLAAIALAAVAVFAFAGSALQRPALARLREQARELKAAGSTPSPARDAAPAPVPEAHVTRTATGSVTGSLPLTPSERVELMELRSRVTDLRARQRSLAGATNEIAALLTRLNQMSNFAQGRMPEGYLRRASARNLGQATPEAAVETFFWALEHRDAPTLLTLVSADERTGMERMLADRGSDAFFREMPSLAGYRVAVRRESGPDEVRLELQIGPQKPWVLILRREGGAWRIHN